MRNCIYSEAHLQLTLLLSVEHGRDRVLNLLFMEGGDACHFLLKEGDFRGKEPTPLTKRVSVHL